MVGSFVNAEESYSLAGFAIKKLARKEKPVVFLHILIF